MSEYVTMKAITLKNAILTPQVVQAYRTGILTMSDINNPQDPLKEIYANTYQYLEFPNSSKQAIKLANLVNKNTAIALGMSKPNNLQTSKMMYFPANDPRVMSW